MPWEITDDPGTHSRLAQHLHLFPSSLKQEGRWWGGTADGHRPHGDGPVSHYSGCCWLSAVVLEASASKISFCPEGWSHFPVCVLQFAQNPILCPPSEIQRVGHAGLGKVWQTKRLCWNLYSETEDSSCKDFWLQWILFKFQQLFTFLTFQV